MVLALRLTEPQEKMLRSAAARRDRGITVRPYSIPLRYLLRYGFMSDGEGGKGTPNTYGWFITKAGLKWIEEKDAERPATRLSSTEAKPEHNARNR